MTKRQKALGVTEYGYQRGIVEGAFLADHEAFLAKIATVKKGQYRGRDIAKMFFAEEFAEWGEGYISLKLEQMKPYLIGLTFIMPEHIYYTDTLGLDCLTLQ